MKQTNYHSNSEKLHISAHIRNEANLMRNSAHGSSSLCTRNCSSDSWCDDWFADTRGVWRPGALAQTGHAHPYRVKVAVPAGRAAAFQCWACFNVRNQSECFFAARAVRLQWFNDVWIFLSSPLRNQPLRLRKFWWTAGGKLNKKRDRSFFFFSWKKEKKKPPVNLKGTCSGLLPS